MKNSSKTTLSVSKFAIAVAFAALAAVAGLAVQAPSPSMAAEPTDAVTEWAVQEGLIPAGSHVVRVLADGDDLTVIAESDPVSDDLGTAEFASTVSLPDLGYSLVAIADDGLILECLDSVSGDGWGLGTAELVLAF